MALTKSEVSDLKMEARNLVDLIKPIASRLGDKDQSYPACHIRSGYYDAQMALDKFTKAEKLLK